jgi:hypothetical protein
MVARQSFLCSSQNQIELSNQSYVATAIPVPGRNCALPSEMVISAMTILVILQSMESVEPLKSELYQLCNTLYLKSDMVQITIINISGHQSIKPTIKKNLGREWFVSSAAAGGRRGP